MRRLRPPRSASYPLRARLLRVLVVAAVGVAVLFAGSATAASGSPPAAAHRAPVRAAEPVWIWPVGSIGHPLRPFEAPATVYAAGHRGIDIVAQPGMPVRSPAAGVVSFVGVVVDRPVLSIRHGDDLLSSMEPVSATVVEGERVIAGQVVGLAATGAHCSGSCVHLGVRRHGQYISPMLFFGGVERAVLLPLTPERVALAPVQARGWASR